MTTMMSQFSKPISATVTFFLLCPARPRLQVSQVKKRNERKKSLAKLSAVGQKIDQDLLFVVLWLYN